MAVFKKEYNKIDRDASQIKRRQLEKDDDKNPFIHSFVKSHSLITDKQSSLKSIFDIVKPTQTLFNNSFEFKSMNLQK